MHIDNLHTHRHLITYSKVYQIFICFLVTSALLGSKIFGIEIGGFTLFIDRIVLCMIIFLFMPKIINKLLFNNKIMYLFMPMILSNVIILITQSILGINSEYIIATIKLIVLFIEFMIFQSIIWICTDKKNIHKIFVKVMYIILIVGILESLGIKVLESKIFDILPKTSQQYKDLNLTFYRGEHIRISSFYTHSLAFGTVLSLYIPYLYYLYKNRLLSKVSFLVSFILTNYCLFITYSRTALVLALSFYVFLLIRYLLYKKNSVLTKILYCFIAILASALVFNVILDNMDIFFPQGANDKSILMRIEDYKFIKKGFEESPILGSGVGSYRDKYNNAIDNYYLTTLYESGIVGLILLIIFILLNFKYLNRELEGDYLFAIKYIFYMIIIYNFTMDAFGFIEIMKFYLIIIALCSKKYINAIVKERRE